MKTKQHYAFALAMFLCCALSFSQNNYWTKVSKESLITSNKVHRASQPANFETLSLNLNSFKQALQNAPLAETVSGRSQLIMEFPLADGTFERFTVSESPIMELGLAERYPMIKTYKAIGLDDPTATMRFSVTQFGLHTMSLSGKRSSVYVDPYTEDRNNYMVYDRVSLGQDTQSFECLIEESIDLESLKSDRGSVNRVDTGDQKLRTYRLAQSCTGEYGQIFAGTGSEAQQKANVQAQMAITINRVNEVYERDLAVRLVFVANNDAIIFLNPATDDWNGEYNTQTAVTIDNTIGVANYDIGHNFNTTGGGNAGCLGCVCASTSQGNFHKGRAYTGRANPTGDPFDIDYVAHEMGHQFDGYHSMNTCSRSGNGTTEVEPASGSSIMGYAGICGTNVQNNSDAHFNYVNVRDISTNIQSGESSSCDVETTLANQPPVADAGSDYAIPPSTAYVLRGTATDPDGMASLTYNWSQNDPERAPGNGSPESTWTVGPLYRSILPTTSPDRFMPSWDDVVAGNLTPTWEVTPSVAREMNFSFIVRDNGSGFANGIGQTDADLMTVNVQGSAPFTVVSPPAWGSASSQTLTWNVSGTNTAPINCQTVNIKFSTDGGLTFPTTLASGVPNDGSETINVPAVADTNNARVMVEAADNIFYALSNNFPISSAPSFALSAPNSNQSACNIDMVAYEINFATVNGFSETVTLSAAGNPAGSTVIFTPGTLDDDGQTLMEVSNLIGAIPGNYTITVSGTSASDTKMVDVELTIVDGLCPSVGTTQWETSTTLVQFADIDNPSGKPSGYSDYTISPTATQTTEVTREDSYDLVVNMNTDGAPYTCVSTVWIDWNQNCVFDANETYDLGSATGTADGPSSNSPLSVVVPADAIVGTTTMRVTTKFSSAATSCETAHDAEVEDYSIDVLTQLGVSDYTLDNLSIFPNPNQGEFTIKFNAVNSNTNVQVFDLKGRAILHKTYSSTGDFNQTINLKNAQSGMYLLQINNGSRTITKKIIIE